MLNAKTLQPSVLETLRGFSEGRMSRNGALLALDVDYSELHDLMVKNGFALPELSDAAAASEGRKMADFLAARGV